MKRNQLEELGLEKETIDKILDINGQDIEKAKGNLAELTQENESLKGQLEDRDKDLKDLQKQAKDNEDLSKQYKDLQAKYKQDSENLTNQLNNTKLNYAVDSALTGYKARNTKAVKSLLDMNKVALDDEGKVQGLEDQVKALTESDPYLFDQGEKQDYEPSGGKTESSAYEQFLSAFKGEE